MSKLINELGNKYGALTSGHTRSCGCKSKEIIRIFKIIKEESRDILLTFIINYAII